METFLLLCCEGSWGSLSEVSKAYQQPAETFSLKLTEEWKENYFLAVERDLMLCLHPPPGPPNRWGDMVDCEVGERWSRACCGLEAIPGHSVHALI